MKFAEIASSGLEDLLFLNHLIASLVSRNTEVMPPKGLVLRGYWQLQELIWPPVKCLTHAHTLGDIVSIKIRQIVSI